MIRPRSAWLEAGDLFAALAIVSIWPDVLFVGVFGPDFVSVGKMNSTTISSRIAIAFFALFATFRALSDDGCCKSRLLEEARAIG